MSTGIYAPGSAAVPIPRPGARRRLEDVLGRDYRTACPFLLPMLVLMFGLIGWPLVQALYLSLTRTVGLQTGPFIGLGNYVDIWKSSEFHESLGVTVKFTFFSVFTKFWVALAGALVLNSNVRWKDLWTALVLLPWIVPEVVTSLVWRAIYDPIFGGLNALLLTLHLTDKGISWLGDPRLALPSVIVVNVWKGIPFFTVVLLSGLKAIDPEQYAAAAIDGATAFRQFLHITLPGLRYVIIVCVLLSSIWTFNGFGLVYLLTAGGPGNATELYSIYAYRAISAFQYASGTAIALSMAPVLALFIILFGRYMLAGSADPDVVKQPRVLQAIARPFAFAFGLLDTAIMAIIDGVETAVTAIGRATGLGNAGSKGARRRLRVVGAVYLALLLLFEMFPFYWCIITAFKTDDQISSGTHLFWPAPWTADHFGELLFGTSFPTWFINTVQVAIITTIISTFCASLGAYAITRLRWKGARVLSAIILITYLVPGIIMVIPMYKILTDLHVINTVGALMVSYPAFIMPFATWLLMGYYRSIPEELEEAAHIDGCTRFQAFYRIVIPLTLPALLATALFAITNSWNEFLFAFVFIFSEGAKTLPVGLAQMVIGDIYPWGQMMAAALMMAIPVMVIYTVGQRVMVGGLTAGAVKQ